MLELRPNCECCNKDLPPEAGDAVMCSFECTFCRDCAETLGGRCPNCGGELVARPRRPAEKLAAWVLPNPSGLNKAALDVGLVAHRREGALAEKGDRTGA